MFNEVCDQWTSIQTSGGDFKVELEFFRTLRNCYAVERLGEGDISHVANLADSAISKGMSATAAEHSEDSVNLIRVCLQLLTNIRANAMGELYLQNGRCEILLRHSDFKVRNFCAALALATLKRIVWIPGPANYITLLNLSTFQALLYAVNYNSEFAVHCLVFVLVLFPVEYWMDLYPLLNVDERLQLLDLVLSLSDEGRPSSSIGAFIFQYLQLIFKREATKLLTCLRSDSSSIPTNPQEFMRILSLLCRISYKSFDDPQHLHNFQSDASLLIDCVYLLKLVHKSSTLNQDWRTPASKLSQSATDSDLCASSNPVFGLKKDLITMIANMCWKNGKNQDEVREMDAIPLIMDCAVLDAKNPLITQWVVFTLKSLMMNNPKNQELLKSLDKQGVTDKNLIERMSGVRLT